MKLSSDFNINSEVNLEQTNIRDYINHSVLSFNSYSFPVISLINFCFAVFLLALLMTYRKIASLVLALSHQVKFLTVKNGNYAVVVDLHHQAAMNNNIT